MVVWETIERRSTRSGSNFEIVIVEYQCVEGVLVWGIKCDRKLSDKKCEKVDVEGLGGGG